MQSIFGASHIKKRITLNSWVQERELITQYETWDLMSRIPIAGSDTIPYEWWKIRKKPLLIDYKTIMNHGVIKR